MLHQPDGCQPSSSLRCFAICARQGLRIPVYIDDLIILAEINEQARVNMDRIWAEERLARAID